MFNKLAIECSLRPVRSGVSQRFVSLMNANTLYFGSYTDLSRCDKNFPFSSNFILAGAELLPWLSRDWALPLSFKDTKSRPRVLLGRGADGYQRGNQQNAMTFHCAPFVAGPGVPIFWVRNPMIAPTTKPGSRISK
jgi:hypothetical protein